MASMPSFRRCGHGFCSQQCIGPTCRACESGESSQYVQSKAKRTEHAKSWTGEIYGWVYNSSGEWWFDDSGDAERDDDESVRQPLIALFDGSEHSSPLGRRGVVPVAGCAPLGRGWCTPAFRRQSKRSMSIHLDCVQVAWAVPEADLAAGWRRPLLRDRSVCGWAGRQGREL